MNVRQEILKVLREPTPREAQRRRRLLRQLREATARLAKTNLAPRK